MGNLLEILMRAKGGDQVKREMKKASGSAEATSKIFLKLGALLSVGLFAKGISSAIRAYGVQEKAVTKLNAALRIQNDFTIANSKALRDQASALQKVTTFGDEAIIASQALLLTYKLTKEEVRAAIPIILDMAAATGKDLRIATDTVGRAIGGQTTLLKTFGVVIDETAFKSRGMTAILEALESQFKGQAKAVAESGIGPLIQFQNLMGDFQEDIGRNVIPTLNALIKTYLNLSKAMNKNVDNLRTANRLLKEGNLTAIEHNKIIGLVEESDRKGLDAFLLRVEKRLMGNKDVRDDEEQTLKVIEERILKAIEIEKKRLEEFQKVQEEATEKEAEEIQNRFNFRRELREIDLEGVIDSLGRELKQVSENEDRKKSLRIALDNFKRELRVQEAVEIEALNDKITQLFVDGTKDWSSAFESFRNFVVDFILRDIANELVKAIGLGKALKVVLGGVGGGGVTGFLGGILGFQHGGRVPGPIGQPTLVKAHGGETFTPPGRAVTGGSSGQGPTIIFQISAMSLEADRTKWTRFLRREIYPELQKFLRKTGEEFSGS